MFHNSIRDKIKTYINDNLYKKIRYPITHFPSFKDIIVTKLKYTEQKQKLFCRVCCPNVPANKYYFLEVSSYT